MLDFSEEEPLPPLLELEDWLLLELLEDCWLLLLEDCSLRSFLELSLFVESLDDLDELESELLDCEFLEEELREEASLPFPIPLLLLVLVDSLLERSLLERLDCSLLDFSSFFSGLPSPLTSVVEVVLLDELELDCELLLSSVLVVLIELAAGAGALLESVLDESRWKRNLLKRGFPSSAAIIVVTAAANIKIAINFIFVVV